MSNGDGVDIVPLLLFGEAREGVVEGLVDDGKDGFEVGAGGDFGNYSAVGLKNVNLGNDDVAQNFMAVF